MEQRITDEQFIEYVQSSSSITQLSKELTNRQIFGRSIEACKKRIKRLNIDISHFTSIFWENGQKKSSGFQVDTSEYFDNSRFIRNYDLKIRLINEGYFQAKCYQCDIDKWNGLPITIELHHIDGNPKNNNLSNLIFLCPNCHSQTDNYKNKNRNFPTKKIVNCLICNKEIILKKQTSKTKCCSVECSSISKRRCKIRPAKQELYNLLKSHTYREVGEMFNLHPTTIRYWATQYNINKTNFK